jgi:hypothetical protein
VASISFFVIYAIKDSFISFVKDLGKKLVTSKIDVMGHPAISLYKLENKHFLASIISPTMVSNRPSLSLISQLEFIIL